MSDFFSSGFTTFQIVIVIMLAAIGFGIGSIRRLLVDIEFSSRKISDQIDDYLNPREVNPYIDD